MRYISNEQTYKKQSQNIVGTPHFTKNRLYLCFHDEVSHHFIIDISGIRSKLIDINFNLIAET